MPAKKRALAESNSNRPAASKRGKKNKPAEEPDKENEENAPEAGEGEKDDGKSKSDDLANRPPYTYYCVPRPLFDMSAENDAKPEKDQLDEDDLSDKFNEKVHEHESVPASNKPQYKWVMMWESWKTSLDCQRLATYTDPDHFGMYIYNDFHSYGIQELIENQLLRGDEVLSKAQCEKEDLQKAWAAAAGLIHWLLGDPNSAGAWMGCEDGERVNKTYNMIGRMFLTLLNAVQSAHFLHAKSEFSDVGLLMALYLRWSHGMPDYGIDENFLWRREILAYAHKGKFDLTKVGVFGMKDVIKSLEDEMGSGGKRAATEPKSDKWKWKIEFPKFKKQYGTPEIGGQRFNILMMSRAERAGHAFDGKDPLKEFKLKDLREGNIMFG